MKPIGKMSRGFKTFLVGSALCASVGTMSAQDMSSFINSINSIVNEGYRISQGDAPSWMKPEQQNAWYHCQGGNHQACAYVQQLMAAKNRQLETIHQMQKQLFGSDWAKSFGR